MSEKLASCLRDGRDPGKVRHEIAELFRQRIFTITLGYPDCKDARVLAEDPVHKMLVGRAPISGDRLASQSTLSRFENGVGHGERYRLVETVTDTVIDRKRLGRKARTIILDFDPTDDPTHGSKSAPSTTTTTEPTASYRSSARSNSTVKSSNRSYARGYRSGGPRRSRRREPGRILAGSSSRPRW
ncbi:MAG: hypothetical protein GY910_01295 [bacterium]|nr:hypothetical protein [bacterium]